LFLLVLSCGKDTDINSTPFPLVVSAKSLETPGAIRMFTKDGETKDAASIARFVGNVRMHGQNIFEESFESDEDNKITFLSKDSLVFAGMELRYGITEIQPGKFIITRDFQSMAHGPLYGMSVTEDIW